MSGTHPPEEAWVSRLEGGLPDEESRALLDHATACPACEKRRRALERAMAGVRERMAASANPPALPALPARVSWFRVPHAAFRARWIAAAAAVLLAAGAVRMLSPRPPVAEIAWLQGTGGRGLEAGAAAGSAIRPGREIETGAGGRLGIRFGSGAEASWDRSTRARIESGGEIFLSAGEIHVRVPPGARGFAVSTPHGRIVDLGTAFLVATSEIATRVHVVRGSARATAGRSFVDLREGERATLAPGLRAAPVPPEEAEAALAWVREAVFPSEFANRRVVDLLDVLESVSPLRFEYDRGAAEGARVRASLGGVSSEAIAEALLDAAGWRWSRDGWNVKVEVPGNRGPE